MFLLVGQILLTLQLREGLLERYTTIRQSGVTQEASI